MILPAHLIGASKLVITSENKVLRNELTGFKTAKRQTNASQRWVLELKTGGLDYNSARELFTYLCMAEGSYNTIQVPNVLPKMSTLTTATVVSLKGNNKFWASYFGDLHVGEFIQFDNHPKVYIVTAIDGLELTIYPDLQVEIDNSMLIHVGSAVNFHCELASDTADLAFAVNDNELTSFTIDFNEEIV